MTGEQIIGELGSFDGAAEILQAWRDGMAPEPALLVSDWADKHRMLGSRGSAEPGTAGEGEGHALSPVVVISNEKSKGLRRAWWRAVAWLSRHGLMRSGGSPRRGRW